MLEDQKKEVQYVLTSLQAEFTQMQADSERYKRDLVAKDELIVQIEKAAREDHKKQKSLYIALEATNLAKIEMMGLTYEDIRSYCSVLYTNFQTALVKIATLEKNLAQEINEKNQKIFQLN